MRWIFQKFVKIKKGETFKFCFMQSVYFVFGRVFLDRVVNAMVHKVTITIAAATEMSPTLLNSGTFGVELVEAEDPGLGEAEEVGLEPLDGSDITARLPMEPDVEPGLLTA